MLQLSWCMASSRASGGPVRASGFFCQREKLFPPFSRPPQRPRLAQTHPVLGRVRDYKESKQVEDQLCL